MEALKILRRIAYYLVFLVSATLCFYELISLSLTTYTELWKEMSFDLLLQEVYLPILYAFFSLGIALLVQTLLIRKPSPFERTIYPWTLMVYFGIGAIVSLIVLAIGLNNVSSEPYNSNPYFLVIPLAIALLFTLSEVFWGFLDWLRGRKEDREEKAKSLEEEKKAVGGVSLHKED